MRKIFLFLFAAVLSIGTAMAQTEVYLTDATVSLDGQNLVVQAQWGERQITISLWQQNIQGTGYYAAADIYCSVLNPWGEWTATTDENSYQEMGGSFSFSGYFTDGTETYDVWIRGSLESSTPETGEMESTDVEVSISEGEWLAAAYAEDGSWSLTVQIEGYEGYNTYEVVALYNDETMLFGTGSIYFDELTGKDVFKADGLYSEDGSVEIYPILYVSSLSLYTETPNIYPAEESSWSYNYDFAGYSYINLISDDWTWWLDLHIKDFAGDGTYELGYETYSQEVWNDWADNGEGGYGAYETVTTRLYSKFNDDIPVIGEVKYSVEDGLSNYECSLNAVDADGNPGMAINAILMQTAAQEAQEYNIEATATIAEGNYYPLEFTCTWNDGDMDHSVKVEVTEVKYNQEIWANFIFDGGISANGDQAEATVTVTKSGNTVTVVGSFESWNTGNIYNVNLSGTLPAGILETVVFADGEDYTDLLAQYAGQKVNAQVERMLLNDGLNTLTLPFDIAASQIGNIKAYQITSVVENRAEEIEIVCTEKTTLLAGQPYIIEVLGRSIWAIEANGVVIKNVSPSNVVAKGETTTVTMHGVLNTTDETTDGLWWIGEEGYLYNDDVTKLGLRAYFSITTSTGIAPRMRVVTSENAATGIDNITTSENATKAIVNGQLIIIRNGEKFNVQGQLMK